MIKFECTKCPHRKCTSILEDSLCSPPENCVSKYVPLIPNWQEVKEETAEVERPAKAKLLDWVKECAIGYDNEQERYFKVMDIDKKWVDIEYLDDGIGATCDYSDIQKCSEARRRPFNAEEMRGLVGKVIQDKLGNLNLVNKYLIVYNEIIVFNAFYTPQKLLESDFTIDGKPCYVLEHKNENGEWVE